MRVSPEEKKNTIPTENSAKMRKSKIFAFLLLLQILCVELTSSEEALADNVALEDTDDHVKYTKISDSEDGTKAADHMDAGEHEPVIDMMMEHSKEEESELKFEPLPVLPNEIVVSTKSVPLEVQMNHPKTHVSDS